MFGIITRKGIFNIFKISWRRGDEDAKIIGSIINSNFKSKKRAAFTEALLYYKMNFVFNYLASELLDFLLSAELESDLSNL